MYVCDNDFDESKERKANLWITNNIESAESNYQAILSGNYEMKIYTRTAINEEATLRIIYEPAGNYNGEVEYNDSFNTADKIETGKLYYGAESYESGPYMDYDYDYYFFELKKSSKVTISVNSSTAGNEKNAYPTLYKENLNQNVEVIGRSYFVSEDLPTMRLAPGKYFIKIAPWHSSSGDEYDNEYTLYVNSIEEAAESYEQEKNDLSSQANLKNVNQWYAGNINSYYSEENGSAFDVDWYKFNVSKKSYIAPKLKTLRQNSDPMENIQRIQLTLYDGSAQNILTEMESTENPYLESEEILVNPGTYYICLTSGDVMDWDYSICLGQREYIPPELSSKNMTVEIGKYAQLQLLQTSGGVTWQSNNNAIATVDSNGMIRGMGIGKTTITATYKGEIYKCVVTVAPVKQSILSLKSYTAGTATLKWKMDKRAKGYYISYSTDPKFKNNLKNAYVTNYKTYEKVLSKLIKGKNYYFRVRSYGIWSNQRIYGTYSDIKKIKISSVVRKPSIKLNEKSVRLYTKGDNAVQLKATVIGKSQKVVWKSANSKIATVDSRGKVKARRKGTTTITVKANGVTAKCKVTVTVFKTDFKRGSWYAYRDGGYYFKIHSISGNKMRFSLKMYNEHTKNKIATIEKGGKKASAIVVCEHGKRHGLSITWKTKRKVAIKESSSCPYKLLYCGYGGRYLKQTISHTFPYH